MLRTCSSGRRSERTPSGRPGSRRWTATTTRRGSSRGSRKKRQRTRRTRQTLRTRSARRRPGASSRSWPPRPMCWPPSRSAHPYRPRCCGATRATPTPPPNAAGPCCAPVKWECWPGRGRPGSLPLRSRSPGRRGKGARLAGCTSPRGGWPCCRTRIPAPGSRTGSPGTGLRINGRTFDGRKARPRCGRPTPRTGALPDPRHTGDRGGTRCGSGVRGSW